MQTKFVITCTVQHPQQQIVDILHKKLNKIPKISFTLLLFYLKSTTLIGSEGTSSLFGRLKKTKLLPSQCKQNDYFTRD